jgi:hypothetical protein
MLQMAHLLPQLLPSLSSDCYHCCKLCNSCKPHILLVGLMLVSTSTHDKIPYAHQLCTLPPPQSPPCNKPGSAGAASSPVLPPAACWARPLSLSLRHLTQTVRRTMTATTRPQTLLGTSRVPGSWAALQCAQVTLDHHDLLLQQPMPIHLHPAAAR